MRASGIAAVTAEPSGLPAALADADGEVRTLICGSLFLAGEALVLLGAYPWGDEVRFDASELLHAESVAVKSAQNAGLKCR
jgi:hypothetical protein